MKQLLGIDKEKEREYIRLLQAISKLSGLFSNSATPLINYRVAENIFCRSFQAENLSRSDTAYDAKLDNLGIGIKTFICNSKISTEKIAEFNSLSRQLKKFSGRPLAEKLAEYRNDRILLANRTYGIDSGVYHIIARKEKCLILFETDYNLININKIKNIVEKQSSLSFEDDSNFYSFNYSKNTLFRKFEIPKHARHISVEILKDPFQLILNISNDTGLTTVQKQLEYGVDYIILPLYSYKKRKEKRKYIFEKSGLNQWNAGGRQRDYGEIYIPIPSDIHKKFPNFFPPRDTKFNLKVPTKEILRAKLCQENSKALMTDPNKALSDWLLRKVLKLDIGELAKIEHLEKLGVDSLIIKKTDIDKYEVDIMPIDSYEEFISGIDVINNEM